MGCAALLTALVVQSLATDKNFKHIKPVEGDDILVVFAVTVIAVWELRKRFTGALIGPPDYFQFKVKKL